jgi:hydroxymethylpyrimidine/phosphomethylpyrimidine kinase
MCKILRQFKDDLRCLLNRAISEIFRKEVSDIFTNFIRSVVKSFFEIMEFEKNKLGIVSKLGIIKVIRKKIS